MNKVMNELMMDKEISEIKDDTVKMLTNLMDHGIIQSFKVSGAKFNIDIDPQFNWDNSHIENASQAVKLAHTFVLGMYTTFMICSQLHVRIVTQYKELLEQQKQELEKLQKPKNLIITPGSSLL